jgi:alkylation response protein AidB-like acyl-CoA dehydrogenase
LVLEPFQLPAHTRQLRDDVRAFLQHEEQIGTFKPGISGWTTFSRSFSKRLATKGWIGVTWPRRYGGQDLTALDRFVITEELLAAGAPLASHWPVDRQIGPLILQHGSEEQRQLYLPQFASGDLSSALGISEPDAGSDVAAIRTRATKVEGGWLLNGRKIWTSNAHNAQMMVVLCRTEPLDERDRHKGFSHLIVPMPSEGVHLRPIQNLAGKHHFNEILFENVYVPDGRLIGEAGEGWRQLESQLALERAGPERFMSTFPLIGEFIGSIGVGRNDLAAITAGKLVSHLWVMRQMTLSVAGTVSKGASPVLEAALTKELGTRFEQSSVENIREEMGRSIAGGHPSELLRDAILNAPSFTLRGGANEILRGIIARGLGLR